MLTIKQCLIEAQHNLLKVHDLSVAEAHIEAQVLMRKALSDKSRAWLIAHDNELIEEVQFECFNSLIQRRLNGEPVAYILGVREFFGLDLKLTPAVLIPRPETETLVETALASMPEDMSCRVLDLGTGSGSIALAVGASRPLAYVTGVEQSEYAIKIARENASRLKINNVDFLLSDWFSALGCMRYQFIVSNPPYIAVDDPHLTRNDLRFEPRAALVSGADGLDDIRYIVKNAAKYLDADGWLMLEHGHDQAEKVSQLLRANNYSAVESFTDLSGILRVTIGRYANHTAA